MHLPRALKTDAEFQVRISYRASPQRGLYFVGKTQAWTQGQDIDSRHYFPCLDTPAQKCTSEVKATFPRAMTALSNGALISDTVKGARRTMHYRLDAPHAPYLVTLVVGSFEVHEAKAGSTKIRTFFPPGRKDDALRVRVARTPKMIALFEELTGVPYPFGDYSQIFVVRVHLRRHGEHLGHHADRRGAARRARARATTRPSRSSRTSWRTSGSATCSPAATGRTAGSTRASPPTSRCCGRSARRVADEADHQRKLDLEAT